MTRRGSLAYYLTAWIVGCFFMTLAIFVVGPTASPGVGLGLSETASSFIFVYFIGLIVGASTALFYGFLLRRLMIWTHANRIWQWTIVGAALAIPIVFALRWVKHFRDLLSILPFFMSVLMGAGLANVAENNHNVLAAALAGAATSATLFYVHRAFAQK